MKDLKVVCDRYPVDISSTCAVMTDEGLGDPVDRLAAVTEIMLEEDGEECLDHAYNSFLEELTNTTWRGGGRRRQWVWQTCTEFGWYQTSNQVRTVVETWVRTLTTNTLSRRVRS